MIKSHNTYIKPISLIHTTTIAMIIIYCN